MKLLRRYDLVLQRQGRRCGVILATASDVTRKAGSERRGGRGMKKGCVEKGLKERSKQHASATTSARI